MPSNNVQMMNFALSNKTGQLPFYSIPKSADSSLIGSPESSKVIQVATYRLDDIVEYFKFEGVVLLKMDAEGAEPEVLSGAVKTLQKVHICLIDAGAEGFNKKTDTEVSKILEDCGFEVEIFEVGILHGINKKLIKQI